MTQYGICGTNLISINITGDIYLICKPTSCLFVAPYQYKYYRQHIFDLQTNYLSICSTLSERFAGQGERVEVRTGDNF